MFFRFSFFAGSSSQPNSTSAPPQIPRSQCRATLKTVINPENMRAHEKELLLHCLSEHKDETMLYATAFPSLSLRHYAYEPNTEPPLFLIEKDFIETDKRHYYLIGNEFHDGKFGVKLYHIRGVFTVCNQQIHFTETPDFIVKKQFHSSETSCHRSIQEFEFNVAAGYSRMGHSFIQPYQSGYLSLFIMNWIKGTNLESLIKNRYLFSNQKLSIFGFYAIFSLLDIHNLGITHRDIKPSNIIIDTSNPAHPVVKIIDFDMSKLNDIDDAGKLVGTPEYTAPEVYLNESTNFKSDVFSLGIVLSELFGIHYLRSHKKPVAAKPDSPFIVMDSYRYNSEMASLLICFLSRMTDINRVNRFTLEEAKVELARIILISQIHHLKKTIKNDPNKSNQVTYNYLIEIIAHGGPQVLIDTVTDFQLIKQYKYKIKSALYQLQSIRKHLNEYVIEARNIYASIPDKTHFHDHLKMLLQIQINKAFLEACHLGKLPVIQHLLKNGYSFRHLLLDSCATGDFSSLTASPEIHAFLQQYVTTCSDDGIPKQFHAEELSQRPSLSR